MTTKKADTAKTRRAAEHAKIDCTLMTVSPTAYREFAKRLDRPAMPNDRLRRTMQSKKVVWSEQP